MLDFNASRELHVRTNNVLLFQKITAKIQCFIKTGNEHDSAFDVIPVLHLGVTWLFLRRYSRSSSEQTRSLGTNRRFTNKQYFFIQLAFQSAQ